MEGKKLKGIVGRMEFAERIFNRGKKVVFSVVNPETGVNTASVNVKIHKNICTYAEIVNINVDENLRGESSEDESGYGGTIIRGVNKELIDRGYFGVLNNQTFLQNDNHPQVVDFYLKHGWEYFDEAKTFWMYYKPSMKFISPEDFEKLKQLYT